MSQRVKNWLAAILGVVMIFLMASLLYPVDQIQERLDSEFKDKVVIGMVRWPGYLPLFVADKGQLFQKQGVDVEIKIYDNLSDLANDYRDGRITGKASTPYEAVNEALNGIDQKVVLAFDRSYGADAIIGRPDIKYVEELRGKKVGFEYGTLEEFFLRYVLDEKGMNLGDILPVNLSPEQAAQAVIDGTVDATVTFEPSLSKALNTGKVNVIFSTVQEPGIITDILTFKSDFVRSYPKTVENIVSTYFIAYDYWRHYPKESNAIVAEFINDSPENVADQLQRIQLLGLIDNEVAFAAESGFHSLRENITKAFEFAAKERGELFITQRAQNMLDARFIRKIYNQK